MTVLGFEKIEGEERTKIPALEIFRVMDTYEFLNRMPSVFEFPYTFAS